MVLLEPGSIVAGRYRLERVLARGGMSSLWVARHLQLDGELVIKFADPEQVASSEALARFEREARALAQLRSPNVVHVYDYGVDDGTPFLAMELLEGEDLAARLRRERRLSKAATLGIVAPLCKALHRAHELSLVHRDLKPANIFLARQEGEEVVKILDFGIAKRIGPGEVGKSTRTGALIGSPHYMSPEQVRRSKAIDQRSDLWSLGVIIFRCLTGQLPFPGEEIGDVLVAICSEDIPLASQLSPDLGPEVDRFLLRALTRDPQGRFQSAIELADAFAAAVEAPARLSAPGAYAPPAQISAAGALALPAQESAASGEVMPPWSGEATPPPGSAARAGAPVELPSGSGTLAPAGRSLVRRPSRIAGVLAAVLAGVVGLALGIAVVLNRTAPDASSSSSALLAASVAEIAAPTGSGSEAAAPAASAEENTASSAASAAEDTASPDSSAAEAASPVPSATTPPAGAAPAAAPASSTSSAGHAAGAPSRRSPARGRPSTTRPRLPAPAPTVTPPAQKDPTFGF